MADLDGDGVDDALESSGRTAMMVAMQIGEKFGRLREELARNAAGRDDAESKTLVARFEAERGAARAELRVVDQPEWWDRATPQDIARVIETAETWKGQDDTARRAAERIDTEVRERYGVDVSEFRSDGSTERSRADRDVTEAALLVAEADRLDRDAAASRDGGTTDERTSLSTELEQRADEYERRAAEGGDGTNNPEELRELAADARSQAQLYRDMESTDQQAAPQTEAPTPQAQANRAEAATLYDSSERRRDTAAQMESSGVEPADVRARMRVDVDQARPAAEAVAAGTSAGTRAPAGVQARGARRNERGR